MNQRQSHFRQAVEFARRMIRYGVPAVHICELAGLRCGSCVGREYIGDHLNRTFATVVGAQPRPTEGWVGTIRTHGEREAT